MTETGNLPGAEAAGFPQKAAQVEVSRARKADFEGGYAIKIEASVAGKIFTVIPQGAKMALGMPN